MKFIEIFIIFLILYFIFNSKKIMGLIEEYKKLPFWAKSIIVTLICMIPFWILSFYLFKQNILINQWYVILSITLAISIGYCILNIINMLLYIEVILNKDYEYFSFGLFFQSIIELCIVIIIAWIFSLQFKIMIYILFGLNIWRCLFLGSISIMKKDK